MKRETRHLLSKAVNSLILCVEHYNRPMDRGRMDFVLILLDHAYEMLLKAVIIQRGGKIHKPGEHQTISFRECLGKALSEKRVRFLTTDQERQIRALNGLRNAAQHYLLDLSEQHLYIHVQSGFTLFRDIYRATFGTDLNTHLPDRVLPISTIPPTDISAVFEDDMTEIQRLLKPGKRQRVEAMAKLRALAIVDRAMHGEDLQPTDSLLEKCGKAIANGQEWQDAFPGAATIQLTTTGTGPSLDLRISKRDGIPIRLVSEGTTDVAVVAVQKVDSLGFYNLGRDQVAKNLGLTGPKTSALVWYLNIKNDDDCFRRVTIGKTSFDRYSRKAIGRIQDELPSLDLGDVWEEYKARTQN